MNDYQIIHFNGAARTADQETTDATAIHPTSKQCELFIIDYCILHDVCCVGGVAVGKGLLSELIQELENQDFVEDWTLFTDTCTDQLGKQEN